MRATLLRLFALLVLACATGLPVSSIAHTATPAVSGSLPVSPLSSERTIDLLPTGELRKARLGDGFPDDASPGDTPQSDAATPWERLGTWIAGHEPARRVNLLGGDYWLAAGLRHDSDIREWVFNPSNTLIDEVEARIYAPDGGVQRVLSGYRHESQYMLHYGKRVHLEPGVEYRVLVRFSSPYFASSPEFKLLTESAYRQQVLVENLLIIGALGALCSLALFYFFIHLSTGDRSQLWYSLYLVCYGIAWALVFHIPVELFGLRNLALHYVPFMLLPVLNTLFYLNFLQLSKTAPRLARLSRINFVLPALFLPSCFLAVSYAHTLATIAIAVWLSLALASGIVCWRRGFRPARYFVFAFLALIVPAMLILPANIGLVDEIVDNTELLTLLGGTLDALLLAFALADKIKLLYEQKDEYLARLNETLELARTDSLTRLGNRYAFDVYLNEHFSFGAAPNDGEQEILLLIDLDGLKHINDRHGHATGDALLRGFADGIRDHCGTAARAFRLGGDEFALLARRRDEASLHAAISHIERDLIDAGFTEAGVSYGIAYAHECAQPADLINYSDQRMYRHKASRKGLRLASPV